MGPTAQSLKQAWTNANSHQLGLMAAGVAYFAFLALVPLLAAIVLVYGLVTDPETIARHAAELAQRLPASATELVVEQLQSVSRSRGDAKGFGLLAALALSLVGARSGAGAIISGLNIAFGASESRSFLRANLLALAITAGALVAIGLMGAASAISSQLVSWAARAASFAILAGAGFSGAALLYRVAPNTQPPPWHACARGAALFAAGWLVASVGFGIYAANFGNYNATYGSLSAVIVLLTWLFISAFLLLLGGFVAAQGAAERA